MANSTPERRASTQRITTETNISATVNLDGTGKYQIETGIGFLNHMLEQLSKHSKIDIELSAQGDHHIDDHHTTEDCGYVIGEAIAKALGDRAGIQRFAHAYVPMDETLSRVAIDVSGRPYCHFKLDFSRDKLGNMDTELFREWFTAFAGSLKATLHVEVLYGINNHHMIEASYKALAISLKKALSIDAKNIGVIPSTKGSISG